MQCNRAYLYAHSTDSLTELAWIHYGRYLNERLEGKPTQYITHRQEFFGRDFFVDKRVLIPRPETEHLVQGALDLLANNPVSTVVDLGTGSGAIAISIALEAECRVFASDISTEALNVADKNRKRHNAPVQLVASDLLQAFTPNSVDLLVSNPPYVPGADSANMQKEVRDWEPHVALFASDDGLDIYRQLIPQAGVVIRRGGRLMMELGYQSLSGVQQMLATEWQEINVVHDLAGWPRVIVATRR